MTSLSLYTQKTKDLLTPEECSLFRTLGTPHKLQDFLDAVPINFDDTHHSPRYVLQARRAQCIEGAMLAAAVFAYHGQAPILLDLRTIACDEDHVVALFRAHGHWGAVSKTNHAILRFRDPVYKSVRELAMSYFHEYAMDETGEKTMRDFSRPFDLRRFSPESWIIAPENLWWLAEALDNSPHERVLPKTLPPRGLRHISDIERAMLKLSEWKKPQQKRGAR